MLVICQQLVNLFILSVTLQNSAVSLLIRFAYFLVFTWNGRCLSSVGLCRSLYVIFKNQALSYLVYYYFVFITVYILVS